MSLPTQHQARELIRKIRRLDLPKDHPDWTALQKDLLEALHRDRSGVDTADGYSRGTLGGGTGSGELTSVEGAASSRIAGRTDELHDHLERAANFLEEAALNVGAFTNRLALIETIVGTPPKTARVCESHHRVKGDTTEPEIYGTVGGRLTKNLDLCRACWDFVRAHDRIPTDEEINEHSLRGKFRVRSHTSHTT